MGVYLPGWKIRSELKAVLFAVTVDYKVPNVSLAVTRCVLGMLSHSVTVMMTQRSHTNQ